MEELLRGFKEIVVQIMTFMPDSRPLYLASKECFRLAPGEDFIFWITRDDVMRTVRHLPKIPTQKTAAEFAQYGNLQMVEFLHAKGEDITANNNEAIIIACRNDQRQVIQFLCSVGADITARNNEAIRQANWRGNQNFIEFLRTLGATL